MPGEKTHEIVMPQLGLSMDSGQIIQWLKKSGDLVRQGEILLEVESDKSVVEVEAVSGGQLHIVHGPEAGQVKVGEVIGYLLTEGAALPGGGQSAGPATLPAKEATAPAPGAAASLLTPPTQSDGQRRLPSTPAARRRAAELGVDWRLATPSGLRGQIREPDVIALAEKHAVVKSAPMTKPGTMPEIAITPVARRLAEVTGLDLAALAQEHPGKRLDREDVEQALRQATSAPQLAASQGPVGATQPAWPLDEIHRGLPARHEPVSLLRRVVAERMAASAHTGAAVTLITKADATELVRLREAIKVDGSVQPTPGYNVLLAALAARALVEHPLLNATLNGDEIIFWEIANVGIAVDTARGLVVPVLRDAAAKTLPQLAVEAEDLLARAAAGKAQPDELSGGTFTITNLGAQDIDFFTPVINPPQCAVLGVGRLNKEWVVGEGDQPVARTMLPLSLTFDHRLVDGAPAARFLKRLKQFVEQPYLWLR
jgi:pyruvate dehydrogenase E2 component (dihydrolipoamide acetyltransferase)